MGVFRLYRPASSNDYSACVAAITMKFSILESSRVSRGPKSVRGWYHGKARKESC
jgi:hypothetical protein